jgi:hypothetical protein
VGVDIHVPASDGMIQTQILCDNCGAVGSQSAGPDRYHAHSLREVLRLKNWHVGQINGTDYCPECWMHEKKMRLIRGDDKP